MHIGEFTFANKNPSWVSKVDEEVGALMSKYIKIMHDEVSRMSK